MANSRKKSPPPEPVVISPEILEQARKSLETDKILRTAKCVVCAMDTPPNSSEGLCWVCRRLKISAWRDNDIQMNAQE
jgi:hypothetical protein